MIDGVDVLCGLNINGRNVQYEMSMAVVQGCYHYFG